MYSIDSFKILIPLNEIDYFNDNLIKKTLTIYEDFFDNNEIILNTKNSAPLEILVNGFKIIYGYMNIFEKKYIYVLIHSKYLGSNYFDGIQKKNIYKLYQFVVSQNVIKVSYDVFLNSNIVDVDIKKDFDMYEENFSKFIYERKQKIKYAKLFADSPNLGIQYTNRNNATPSSPFVKYYSKYHELETRSKMFKDHFLPNFDNQNLRRIEVTIKNSAHRKYLTRKCGFEVPTVLNDWLNLDQDQYKNILNICIQNHELTYDFKPIDKSSRVILELSSKDFFIYCIVREYASLGYDSKMLLGLFEQRTMISDAVFQAQKSRLKKMLKKFEEMQKNVIFDTNLKDIF